MAGDFEVDAIKVGSEETPLVIVFRRSPDGRLSADVKGTMNAEELAEALRYMADGIAKGMESAQ